MYPRAIWDLVVRTPSCRRQCRQRASPHGDRIVRRGFQARSSATYEGSGPQQARRRLAPKGVGRCRVLRTPLPRIVQIVAISRVGSGKADDFSTCFPDKNARVINEPANIFDRDARWITKLVLTHSGAYFHNTRDIESRCLADQKKLSGAMITYRQAAGCRAR
jgi:hypothetical protein